MQKLFIASLLLFLSIITKAQNITGIVTNINGQPVIGASLFFKGSQNSTATNEIGKFKIAYDSKNKQLICKAINKETFKINFNTLINDTIINITLAEQIYDTNTIIVKSGDNPAIKIMQNAIKKRNSYNVEVKEFSCVAYVKSAIKLLKAPKKLFFKPIDTTSVKADSSGNTLIQLSENITQVDYKAPNKVKLTIISGRASGSDNGFGPAIPITTNFYNEIVNIGDQLNPRGFISPLHNKALYYYKFKLDGVFFEDGKLINRIKITPRRKNEPLFTGYIMIIEDTWRMHSIDCWLTKDYQIQILDSFNIQQIQLPLENNTWRPKTQIINAKLKIFGFEAKASYTNVFQDYNLNPNFSKNHFNKVLLKYDSVFNKKSTAYWDSIRPIPLNTIEQKDYIVKDSIFKKEKDSLKLAKPKIIKNPFTLKKLLINGYGISKWSESKVLTVFNLKPIIKYASYNTVEGFSPQLNFSLAKTYFRKNKPLFKPNIEVFTRYGISNKQFNAYANIYLINSSPKNKRNLQISGGTWVNQINNESTLTSLINSYFTLMGKNYAKFYQSKFLKLNYYNNNINGLKIYGELAYENRLPLNNTTNYSFKNKNTLTFTPNYPIELVSANIPKTQAATIGLTLKYQHGIKYMQDAKGVLYPLQSNKPIFTAGIKTALPNIFGSSINYTKWNLGVFNDTKIKMLGTLKYKFNIGGFLNKQNLSIIDLQHLNGNQLKFAGEYLNTFQLAPYYLYSNNASFMSTMHIEHHFNGLFTNKIPLFNKTKITLVAGTNSFTAGNNKNYGEVFVGLENIFKLFRVDFAFGAAENTRAKTGIRIGLGGIFGGAIKVEK